MPARAPLTLTEEQATESGKGRLAPNHRVGGIPQGVTDRHLHVGLWITAYRVPRPSRQTRLPWPSCSQGAADDYTNQATAALSP